MAKLRFTNKAVEDLTSIWNYTFKTWSERQADEYYVWLVEMFWLSAYFTSEWISNAILRKALTDSYFTLCSIPRFSQQFGLAPGEEEWE